VQQFAAVLRDGPLSLRAPRGIHFFLVDNYLGALQKALPDGSAGEIWTALIEPFFQLMGQVEEVHLLTRVTEQVVLPLLDAGASTDKAAGEEGEEGEEEAGLSALPCLLPQLSERLFDLASDPSTREENRPHLYNLQRTAEERAGAVAGTSGAKASAATDFKAVGETARRRGGTAQSKPAQVHSAVPAQTPAALVHPEGQTSHMKEALRGMIGRAARNGVGTSPEPASATEGKRLKRVRRPTAPGKAAAMGAAESTLHHAAAGKSRTSSAHPETGAAAAGKASPKGASRSAPTADREADAAEATGARKKKSRREAGAEPTAARARSSRKAK
jgi:hypothetical protein